MDGSGARTVDTAKTVRVCLSTQQKNLVALHASRKGLEVKAGTSIFQKVDNEPAE